jgi:hypothetical protein
LSRFLKKLHPYIVFWVQYSMAQTNIESVT